MDVLSKIENKTIKCLDKGFVSIVDVMPREVPTDRPTADFAVVQGARVSFNCHGLKSEKEDRGLIRYLFRHNHSTPVELVTFKFHAKMPIFVARQWIRHRTASVNEVSGRYSVMKDEFFVPTVEEVRAQSKSNKQSSEGNVEATVAEEFINDIEAVNKISYRQYTHAIEEGIGKEQARMQLPLNLYTEWYWQSNLHNLFHFLGLRCDAHAQYEMRVFAEAILQLITPIVPWCVEAWNDYHPLRGAIKLTRLEVEQIQARLSGINVGAIDTDNKREQEEWINKASKLGLRFE